VPGNVVANASSFFQTLIFEPTLPTDSENRSSMHPATGLTENIIRFRESPKPPAENSSLHSLEKSHTPQMSLAAKEKESGQCNLGFENLTCHSPFHTAYPSLSSNRWIRLDPLLKSFETLFMRAGIFFPLSSAFLIVKRPLMTRSSAKQQQTHQVAVSGTS
jgi:hypothetical protein